MKGNENPRHSERTRGSKTLPEKPGAGTASGRTGWTVLKYEQHSMQAEGLRCPACIDRGLKRHEKTGSALNVSVGNSPQMIHKMKEENRQMEYEFMTTAKPLPPCMPFPKALAGLPISSTAKVIYCKMLDAMLTKKLEDENGILFVYFPIKQLAAELSRCEMIVKRSLNELENAGLIMRVRQQGFAELNRIYILIPKV